MFGVLKWSLSGPPFERSAVKVWDLLGRTKRDLCGEGNCETRTFFCHLEGRRLFFQSFSIKYTRTHAKTNRLKGLRWRILLNEFVHLDMSTVFPQPLLAFALSVVIN